MDFERLRLSATRRRLLIEIADRIVARWYDSLSPSALVQIRQAAQMMSNGAGRHRPLSAVRRFEWPSCPATNAGELGTPELSQPARAISCRATCSLRGNRRAQPRRELSKVASRTLSPVPGLSGLPKTPNVLAGRMCLPPARAA